MIGRSFSHYRILAELGAGGMGVLYSAEDTRLGRRVALKFLPADLMRRSEAIGRFRREAKLASSLNHPNICTIYDIGEHDGRPFIVMELLEGTTLRDLIHHQPLPLERFLRLSLQIAEALAAAHRGGIIHRDIKPANVFVTREGHAKVLDFGLAKLIQEVSILDSESSLSATTQQPQAELTQPGTQVGTTAYMSPEQARGETLDLRTDLFSLGAVLYEMATGTRAFPGGTVAVVLDAILHRAPPSPLTLNAALPTEVEQIVEKALEKERDLRYQDASDVVADLRRLRRRLEGGRSRDEGLLFGTSRRAGVRAAAGAEGGAKTPRRRRSLVAGLGVVTIVAVVALGRVFLGEPPAALTDRDSILLAAFANSTGETVFDGTLRQALAVQLSQSPFLDIASDQRVRETLQQMNRSPDEILTHDVAREVCERQGLRAMLEASIARLGTRYVVTLDASECATGEALAVEQAEAQTKEAVLAAVGRLASNMRATLGESLASLERFDVPIEQATTSSLEALRAYSLGIAQRTASSEIESIPFLLRAIELDPDFALAYMVLSTVYSNLGETLESAKFARLAYEHRSSVSERERLFITYQYHDRVTGDVEEVIRALTVLERSYPRDHEPPNDLTVVLNRIGRYEQAVEEGQEANRLNPSHPFPYSNLAYAYRGLGRYDDARRVAEEAVALGIETVPTRRLLYQIALIQGDQAAAQRHLDWAKGKPREFDLVGAQAEAMAFAGRLEEARMLYGSAMEMARLRRLTEVESAYRARRAITEAAYGNLEVATALAEANLQANAGLVVRLRAAFVLGLAGRSEQALSLTDAEADARPLSTSIHGVYAPVIRAAVALQRGEPDIAIETLRPAGAYELGNIASLVPAYLRGVAHLETGEGAEAVAEFQKLFDHRGVDPFSCYYPLAVLGRARALTMMGDVEASRRAYETFFDLWQGGDPDLPVLRQARAEYRRLASATTALADH